MRRPILLGSSSPRRKELLERAEIPISRIVGPAVNEPPHRDGRPDDYVMELARRKSEWVMQHGAVRPDEIVLTADTIVVLDGEVLGKPADRHEAAAMLRRLRGRSHQVLTACVMRDQKRVEAFVDAVQVRFNRFSDEDIAHYAAGAAPLDKAGAYGAQDWMGLIGIRSIEGSFYTVMGLPIDRVYAVWRRWK